MPCRGGAGLQGAVCEQASASCSRLLFNQPSAEGTSPSLLIRDETEGVQTLTKEEGDFGRDSCHNRPDG